MGFRDVLRAGMHLVWAAAVALFLAGPVSGDEKKEEQGGAQASGDLGKREQEKKEGKEEQKGERVVFVVVVNKGNPATDLSAADLRAYFRMEKKFWPGKDKTEAAIFLGKADTPEGTLVLKRIYEMTEAQLETYWTEMIYQGKITSAPSVKRSAAALVKAVSQEEGGVAVVPADAVTDAVKTLTVDGKKSGDGGYALVCVPELSLAFVALRGDRH